MSVPVRSSDDILAALREHPEWKRNLLNAFLAVPAEAEEIRSRLLTRDLLELPSRFEKAEADRKEDQNQIRKALRDLADAQRKTDATVQAFAESTEKRFSEVEKRLDSLETTLQSFMESTQAFQRSMEQFKEATERRFSAVEKRLDSLETTLQSFMESTEKRFSEVEKRLDSLETTLQSFMESTEKRFSEVEKRLDSLETTLQSFMESTQAFQRSMEQFKEATEKRLHGIESELDFFAGKSMEVDAGKKLGNYLRERVRKIRRCDADTVDSLIDTALESGHLTEREGDDLGEADALVAGNDRESGKPACVAVEVSRTVGKSDVDRAARRARLFLKAGRAAVASHPSAFLGIFPQPPEKAYALVVGRRIAEEARREAERKGVLFAKYRNGHDREGR